MEYSKTEQKYIETEIISINIDMPKNISKQNPRQEVVFLKAHACICMTVH